MGKEFLNFMRILIVVISIGGIIISTIYGFIAILNEENVTWIISCISIVFITILGSFLLKTINKKTSENIGKEKLK